MKSFIIKTIWFILPLVVISTPIYIFLKSTGENFYSIDSEITSGKKLLIGYAYNQENYRYLKWKNIIEKEKKDVWALGSSRVLQFRENMFDSPFYNAGFTISSIADFLPFMKSIPKEKYPEILIVGLDQWMFNKNWDNISNSKKEQYWENSFSYNPSSNTISSIIRDLYNEKYSLSVKSRSFDSVNNIHLIGLDALVNKKGIRNDGSLYYGKQITMLLEEDPEAKDYEYSDTFNRIEKGNRRFQYGNNANEKAFQKLDEFLEFCSAQNIKVVGFLPPFADAVNQKMIQTEKYGYLEDIYPRALPFFKKYNFELWDMTFLQTYNSSDQETIDGFHGGELTYLRMLIYMNKNNSVLKEYTYLPDLEKAFINRKNRYSVYKY